MTDHLLYPARINALNGQSGSGKTWVALLVVAETLEAGGHVIYVDLEDHPASIVARLRALGVDGDTIKARFTYIQPDRPAGRAAVESVDKIIRDRNTVLLVIDSIGELMSLQGCKPNDDDAVAALYRALPRRWARLGPCVLLVDHVPKNNEASPLYGIGSQRKRAAIDGAAYMVEPVKAFAAGVDGKVLLRTAKDRNGNYPTGSTAAEITIATHADGDRITLDVHAPEGRDATGKVERPTTLMRKVSDWLAVQPDRTAHWYAIQQAGIGSSAVYVKAALDVLVNERHVATNRVIRRGRESVDYTLITPFDEYTDITIDDLI